MADAPDATQAKDIREWLDTHKLAERQALGFWRAFSREFFPSLRERHEFLVFWFAMVAAVVLWACSRGKAEAGVPPVSPEVLKWLRLSSYAVLAFAVWWASVTAARRAALRTDKVGRAIEFMRGVRVCCYGSEMSLAAAMLKLHRELQVGMNRYEWHHRVAAVPIPDDLVRQSMQKGDGMWANAHCTLDAEPKHILTDLRFYDVLDLTPNKDGHADHDTITLLPDGKEAIHRLAEHPRLCS